MISWIIEYCKAVLYNGLMQPFLLSRSGINRFYNLVFNFIPDKLCDWRNFFASTNAPLSIVTSGEPCLQPESLSSGLLYTVVLVLPLDEEVLPSLLGFGSC